MKPIIKSILIGVAAFSFCLNIGFLAPLFFEPARDFVKNKIMKMPGVRIPDFKTNFFEGYGLSEGQKKKFSKIMEDFVNKDRLRNIKTNAKRLEEIKMLSQPGPLNVTKYRKLVAETGKLEQRNHEQIADEATATHVELGEDAPIFFSVLAKKLQEKEDQMLGPDILSMDNHPGPQPRHIHHNGPPPGNYPGPPRAGYDGFPPEQGFPK